MKIKIRKKFRKLREKEIIDLEEKGSKVFVRLKDRNNLTVIKYSTKALLDFKKKKRIGMVNGF